MAAEVIKSNALIKYLQGVVESGVRNTVFHALEGASPYNGEEYNHKKSKARI